LVRGSYTPRGGGYGVISEALTGWWLTAQEDPRLADLRDPIAERATCNAGLAVRAQSDGDDAASAARPERVEGAWFNDGETRMDDQQHALAGLLRTIPIARAAKASNSGSSSDPDDDAPSGWLWALALVLALNPARAAFGIPRAGCSPPTVAGVTAVGGVIGGLLVCAAAAAGDPLLEALDVSDPSFRFAAGIVAGLAGAADLFRRAPSPEPSLAGWRAALIPVAIPLVARPALLVLALGAGADQGVLPSAGAMAIGIALLTGLAVGWTTEGPRGRVLRWANRLLAVTLVACGVILTVDGVLDV
jgi:small neutral amino acid transporter SnatA (MarC family)